MTLALGGWIEEFSPDETSTWHRWSPIPGEPECVWGWDRWCRKVPVGFAAPSSVDEHPPVGAHICRRCRGARAAWDVDSDPLTARPLTLAEANALVSRLHRHHEPVVGHRFSIGAERAGELVGAIIVGRPVARKTDQTFVFEVTRLVTDGRDNVCSFLYARAARVAEAMGAHSIQTFTLPVEGGASLRAAGWTEEATITPPEKGWNTRDHANDMPLFGVRAVTVQGPKVRWRRTFVRPAAVAQKVSA